MECPEHYESIAADVFRTYETSADEEVRRRSADVLGQLWLARRLRSDIKALIVKRHYVPELVQIPLPDGRLELSVVARSSFPFPPVTFTMRSTVYRNGEALWTPLTGRLRARLRPEEPAAGLGTGRYISGDVYTFDIVLDEEADTDVVWRSVLRTNSIAVQ